MPSAAIVADRTQAVGEPLHPFEWALGESANRLAPKVREHALQTLGTRVRYRGVMRVWRDGGWRGRLAAGLLRVAARWKTMFPETGEVVNFEMEHSVQRDPDGCVRMTWIRTFRFGNALRRFDAVMEFRSDERRVVDWVGAGGYLHVELLPREEDNAIAVHSAREWLLAGPLRIPIPDWLKGRPQVREWQDADGSLKIRVEIRNPILGHFFGYEGEYERVSCEQIQAAVTAL